MKRYLILLAIFFLQLSVWAQSHRLEFKTPQGNFKVMLYDFTPQHRDLIVEAVKNGTYHEALFNRVIQNFVVQGGEHDDAIALRETGIPEDQHQRLSAEFDSRAYHKMGALGAGRDDNKQKASFLNQLYFVVGKPVLPHELTELEQKKGVDFTEQQRQNYLSEGGLPRLDGDYTVFGEVYEGLEVLLEISKLKTNSKDAPLQNIPFEIIEIQD